MTLRTSYLLILCFLCEIPLLKGDDFAKVIRPYLDQYCVKCHNDRVTKGELNLLDYQSGDDIAKRFRVWKNVATFIKSAEMPPAEAPQPELDESRRVLAAVQGIFARAAQKNAGDPGVVLPRRLTNTEYNHSIRDLVGVDILPTRSFPPDPAGGEGFNNTGEALTMSPNLLKKYLSAAQEVADHLVLQTTGTRFAPFPVRSYNERKKLTEQAIIDFYQQKRVDTEKYLEAAWRFRHLKTDDGQVKPGIEFWARRNGLSGKYLALVWKTLSEADKGTGILADVAKAWNAIPPPESLTDRPAELKRLTQVIELGRRTLSPRLQQLIKSNAGNWPIEWLDFRARTAAVRDQYVPQQFKSSTLLNVGRIRAPKLENPQPYSIFVAIRQGTNTGKAQVVFQRPIFSLAKILPNNEQDEKIHHKVESLQSVYQRLSDAKRKFPIFGRGPGGTTIDAESFSFESPGLLEIPISVAMQRELQGKFLLMPCALDPATSGDESVLVQYSVNRPPKDQFEGKPERLIFADGLAARELAKSAEVFCNAFPNRFFYVDSKRGLAAGFHLVEGFFRDDQPLVEKVLSDAEVNELNGLWKELDFTTNATETLLRGFVWFERSERHVLHDKRFDFLRPEDPELVTEKVLLRFERLYLDKLGVPAREGITKTGQLLPKTPSKKFDMVRAFFDRIRSGLRQQNQWLAAAEKIAYQDVLELARKAFGRKLTLAERQKLRKLYDRLKSEGQTVEESLRGLVVAILMSPDFCYRMSSAPSGDQWTPLTNTDLAKRLSYFLWSSIPDQELLTAAGKGELSFPDLVVRQTKRMIQDERFHAFATEFFGQWLNYRNFEDANPINDGAFPEYNDALRRAMVQEPSRLFQYLVRNDLPITNLLNSDRTFLNAALAKHYGGTLQEAYRRKLEEWKKAGRKSIKGRAKTDEVWLPVTGLKEAGRGGLFGMAVILTSNSSGERTSPVKRGFWTVHHLLGQHFPPPPADVPPLPEKDTDSEKPLSELLAAHVADAQCAMCHKHFDHLGLAMEGFDPIGRSRQNDRAGRPIPSEVVFPKNSKVSGIPGLIGYIEENRKQEFVRTFCRKFLGFALGRSVILSDQPLLDEMEAELSVNDYRFSVLFEIVVRSTQFRMQRPGESTVAKVNESRSNATGVIRSAK